jgi:hypothetical protein
MPRGQLTRHEILNKVNKLKKELYEINTSQSNKTLANEYLNRVLDYIEEFRY